MRQLSGPTAHVIRSATIGAVLLATSAAQEARRQPTCTPSGPLIRVAGLPEGSGVAASRRVSGRVWAHNDSGEPVLVALNSRGAVVGRVRVSGAKVEDWEALATGPCPAGSCIYIGDIGDNGARRPSITIYRAPEPTEATGSIAVADAFAATYPDGARDAEALLVTAKGDILIVTKGDRGAVGIYRLPSDAPPGGRVTLQRIGAPRQALKPSARERITDGTVSPSGSWTALRSNASLMLYRTEQWLSGDWNEAGRVSLAALGEPQGEGIAFADDETLYLVGEGGGQSQPGTFVQLTCDF
jgi:hypothetical protein